MAILVEHQQYKAERNNILKSMRDHHKKKGNDFKKIVGSFLGDLTVELNKIKNTPCLFKDFPAPVKKVLFSKGVNQCVILFVPEPETHMNNNALVEKAHLISIMLTISGQYNSYVMKEIDDVADLDI